MDKIGRPICVSLDKMKPKGLFFLDNFKNMELTAVPLLALQIAALSLVPRFSHFLLKPLGQPLFVSQLLGGILFGPSFLGRISEPVYNFLFPARGYEVLDTLSLFSSMFFLFKIGVKIDPTVMNRVEKKAFAIGFFSYLTSLLFGFIATKFLETFTDGWEDDEVLFSKQVSFIIVVSSITSFPVIACVLSELNILNSDLGRLTTSSAMVTDMLHIGVRIINIFTRKIREHKEWEPSEPTYAFLSILALVIFIVFVVRPASLWVVKQTPEGEAVKEIYINCIFVTVLLYGLASEVIGLNAMVGTFFLGLAIPEGPPLGACLVEKLDYLVSGVFMPVHVAIAGLKTNFFELHEHRGFIWIAELIVILSCCLGKIVGVLIPSLRAGVPVRNAFMLGLIMNLKGIVEVAVLNVWVDFKLLTVSTHTVIVFTFLSMTAILTPLVRYLYDPSTNYLTYKTRSIAQSKQNSSDFRILVCVHNEADVKPVIRLLDASNPSKITPLNIFVLHLIELVGRASPLLIAHPPNKKPSENPTKTGRIINAFQNFERQHYGLVSIQPFSTISAYTSMHNDICLISLEQKTSLVIFPFQKQGLIDDRIRPALTRSMKILVQNLLRSVPCSLGILIDRTHDLSLATTGSIDTSTYRVVVLFLGGPDDREALAYALNMIHHPSVFVTVVRFFADFSDESDDHDHANDDYIKRQGLLDDELVEYFGVKTEDNNRAMCRKVEVKDGAETVWVIRSMKDDYDLIMVGRRQTTGSNLTAGLSEDWTECEELGVIGDLLSSSDFEGKGSILVVQQQQQQQQQ